MLGRDGAGGTEEPPRGQCCPPGVAGDTGWDISWSWESVPGCGKLWLGPSLAMSTSAVVTSGVCPSPLWSPLAVSTSGRVPWSLLLWTRLWVIFSPPESAAAAEDPFGHSWVAPGGSSQVLTVQLSRLGPCWWPQVAPGGHSQVLAVQLSRLGHCWVASGGHSQVLAVWFSMLGACWWPQVAPGGPSQAPSPTVLALSCPSSRPSPGRVPSLSHPTPSLSLVSRAEVGNP